MHIFLGPAKIKELVLIILMILCVFANLPTPEKLVKTKWTHASQIIVPMEQLVHQHRISEIMFVLALWDLPDVFAMRTSMNVNYNRLVGTAANA